MPYRKVSWFEQVCYVVKHAVEVKLEWLDAKAWANQYHPAWVDFYKRAPHKHVRELYRKMILDGYREMCGEMYGNH